MSDLSRSFAARMAFVAALFALLHQSEVAAQSNCTNPYLGENGEEVCVTITPAPGATPITIRGLGGIGTSGFPVVGTYGQYDLNLNVVVAASGLGLGITTTGTVTRSSAGNDAILIQIEAGWSQPLPDGAGSIGIVGEASGTARIRTGSAAGYPVGAIPAQDVQYNGFPPICDEVVYGPRPPGSLGPFECQINGLPMEAGAVAAQTTTEVHINDVGEFVAFGKGYWGASLGSPPGIPAADSGNQYTGARAQTVCDGDSCSIYAIAIARLELTCMDIGLPAGVFPGSINVIGPDGTPDSAAEFGNAKFTTHGYFACDIEPGDLLIVDFLDIPCSTGAMGDVSFDTNPYGQSALIPFTCILEGAPGSISGVKYEDLNGNGRRDVVGIDLQGNDILEPGIPDWEIYLDGNMGSPAVTDADGMYTFQEVDPGQHTVSEEMRDGWMYSAYADTMVVVEDGEETAGVDFGNYRVLTEADLGDAPETEDPDYPELFPFGYPTTIANNGASHTVDESVHLGDLVDAEDDGQPTTPSDGDGEDEDGVRFANDFISLVLALDPESDDETPVSALLRGTDATIEVSASTAGYLNAWADWNRDGDWDDDGEQMFDNEPLGPGDNELDWSSPEDASIGFTYARFRFTPEPGDIGASGAEGVGEVEDYLMMSLAFIDLASTADTPDANPGDGICADAGGMCTLRAAIMEANADVIPWVVSAEVLGKSGAATLAPQSPYPPITGTLIMTGNGTLEIDGSQAGAGAHGLVFASSSNLITLTSIHSFDGDGIRIEGSNNNVFDTEILNNGGAGINVVSGDGNFVRTNSIDGNGGLGIDLGADGVTDNDAQDADDGPNTLQNYPVLSSVSVDGMIEGALESSPNTETVIDFFASPACDASGAGEGMRYIGSASVTTDGSGGMPFDVELSDAGLAPGDAVTATATSMSGTSEFSGCFTIIVTDIQRHADSELPNAFRLSQNYPNPFNPVTSITFAVPEAEFVTIDVYDILGKHIARVVDRQMPAGEYSAPFDASALPSGSYVYRMTAGAFTETRLMTVLK